METAIPPYRCDKPDKLILIPRVARFMLCFFNNLSDPGDGTNVKKRYSADLKKKFPMLDQP